MIFTRATSIVSDPQFHVSITSQTKHERVLFIQSMLSARPLRVYIHHTVERTSKEAKIWKQNTLMSHPSSTECVRSAPISQLAMETQCKHTQHTPLQLFNKIHISTEKQSQRCCLSRYRNVENTQPKYNTLFDFGWKSESLKRSHSHIVNSNNTNFNTAPYVQCNAFRSEKIEIG